MEEENPYQVFSSVESSDSLDLLTILLMVIFGILRFSLVFVLMFLVLHFYGDFLIMNLDRFIIDFATPYQETLIKIFRDMRIFRCCASIVIIWFIFIVPVALIQMIQEYYLEKLLLILKRKVKTQ